MDYNKLYILDDPEWKYDVHPELMDGKNVMDYYDEDIEARLDALEKEEEAELEQQALLGDMDDDGLADDEKKLVADIKAQQKLLTTQAILAKGNNKSVIPRKYRVRQPGTMEQELAGRGVNATKALDRLRSRSRGRKRTRDDSVDATAMPPPQIDIVDAEAGISKTQAKKMKRSKSRAESTTRTGSHSRPRAPSAAGLKSDVELEKTDKLRKQGQRGMNQNARKGESDRRHMDLHPKHLLTGKRGIGSNTRR